MNSSQHIPRWIDHSAILDPFDTSDPLLGQPDVFCKKSLAKMLHSFVCNFMQRIRKKWCMVLKIIQDERMKSLFWPLFGPLWGNQNFPTKEALNKILFPSGCNFLQKIRKIYRWVLKIFPDEWTKMPFWPLFGPWWGNQIFPARKASDKILPSWICNFMQKIRKNECIVHKIFPDERTK